MMRNFQSILIILVASSTLVACGGGKTVDGNIDVQTVDGTLGGDDASSSGLSGGDSTNISGLGGADTNLLNNRVIYFEYNSSRLSQESKAIVEAHVRYLVNAPAVRIVLEGHADERGTREYNLALSEDRAKAVSNLMQVLGINGNRIQTISYGEERPVSLGNDESTWNLNRRVEILYQ